MNKNHCKQENIRLGTHGEDYGSWMSNPVFYIIGGIGVLTAVLAVLSFYVLHVAVLGVLFTVITVALLVLLIWITWIRRQYAFGGGGIMEQVHRVVLSHLDYDGEGKILEVGCGSGALTIRSALTWPKAKVIGVDYWGAVYNYSKALCEKNAAREGVASRCVFQHGDAKQLDFPDESFDVVISNYVYHNVMGADMQKLLLESLRVLKKGGVFALNDDMKQKMYGDMEDFAQKLRDMGYEEVRLVDTAQEAFGSHRRAAKLGVVEDTLFVPMLGRIYASEHCPQILYDRKTLELKNRLPSDLIKQNMQNQYTLLASASRSANMDRIIRSFLERRPDGVIVQLGCGLETTYHRCDNGKTHWYAVDLPHVIEYRRGLLPEPERELYISGDAFAKDWIKKVRNDVLDAPILVTAGGLFHYFEEHKVIALLRMIGQFGNMEVVFDTVNKRGMTMMKKKYMKQVGHADAQMFFYVDSAEELAAKIGGNVKVIAEEPYYRYIPKNGLKLSTKVSMTVSDQFKMVKMIHLKL